MSAVLRALRNAYLYAEVGSRLFVIGNRRRAVQAWVQDKAVQDAAHYDLPVQALMRAKRRADARRTI